MLTSIEEHHSPVKIIVFFVENILFVVISLFLFFLFSVKLSLFSHSGSIFKFFSSIDFLHFSIIYLA